jgi:hypothetical protein
MLQHRTLKKNTTFDESLANELFLLREYDIPVASGEPFPVMDSVVNLRRFMWKQKSLMYRGFYATQLKEWMKHYTLGENLLVVQYERFRNEPQAILNEICDFLGVPTHIFPENHFNKTYVPLGMKKNQTSDFVLSNATRAFMKKVFQPYNEELADLLGEQWRGVWDDE